MQSDKTCKVAIIIIIIIIKNLYSAKTIEEYSKALYIELIKINRNEILKFKTKVKKHENYMRTIQKIHYFQQNSEVQY